MHAHVIEKMNIYRYIITEIFYRPVFIIKCVMLLTFLNDFVYLFLERGEGEKEEININVWLPLVHPLLETWLTTQACALTEN